MALSNPGKLGLADRLSTALQTLTRTLHTMDKSVDKAEQDPERYNVTISELHQRFAFQLQGVSNVDVSANHVRLSAGDSGSKTREPTQSKCSQPSKVSSKDSLR